MVEVCATLSAILVVTAANYMPLYSLFVDLVAGDLGLSRPSSCSPRSGPQRMSPCSERLGNNTGVTAGGTCGYPCRKFPALIIINLWIEMYTYVTHMETVHWLVSWWSSEWCSETVASSSEGEGCVGVWPTKLPFCLLPKPTLVFQKAAVLPAKLSCTSEKNTRNDIMKIKWKGLKHKQRVEKWPLT